ncbi:hypothetical protein [Negativicoccus succinicivorans]|nr:hypothetical protein [Negativicoccus succinicivorans]MDU2417247.1 hypothetical protein [Negativicoccus succinicivorans]
MKRNEAERARTLCLPNGYELGRGRWKAHVSASNMDGRCGEENVS